MRLIVRGYTQKEIAARLQVSRRTIDDHMADLRAKLGAKTTNVAIAMWMGDVPPGPLLRGPRRRTNLETPDPDQLSPRIRFQILERDSFTCQYCGRNAPDVVLHVDHILARARGGSNDPTNLITACADCNFGKGARLSRTPAQHVISTSIGEPPAT